MSEPSLDEVMSADYEEQASGDEIEAAETTEAESSESEPVQAETETESPPDSAPTDDDKRIDPDQFKGYLDEREKRQKAESEIETLKKQLENTQQPDPAIDPVVDPEGYRNSVDMQMRQVAFEQDLKWMRRTHSDWGEAEAWINEQLGSNVAVQAKLAASDSLLDDSYQMYLDHKALQELQGAGDAKEALSTAQAKIAELEAKLEGREVEQQEQVKSAAQGKPSLAESGTSTGVSSEGFMSLEDVLGTDFNNRQ